MKKMAYWLFTLLLLAGTVALIFGWVGVALQWPGSTRFLLAGLLFIVASPFVRAFTAIGEYFATKEYGYATAALLLFFFLLFSIGFGAWYAHFFV